MLMQKALFVLHKNFHFFFDLFRNRLFLKGNYGIFVFTLPSLFYFSLNHKYLNVISLIFYSRFYFSSFLSHFMYHYRRIFVVFFVRLKVRGLGYRIKPLSKYLIRFFLGTTNYLFFHVPKGILARAKRRRLLLVSNNYANLRLFYVNLLLLKKLIPYQLRGIFFPRQLILMKPGKKTF
jgi:hypothetical protein